MPMQTYIRPFQPQELTQTLAVTATAQTLTLPPPLGNRSFRVVVIGNQTVYWKYITPSTTGPGMGGVTAATVAASVPILAGTVETFFLPNDATGLSFIAGATGSSVSVTLGESA